MSYQHDDQAAEEAARHPLAAEQLDTLRDRLTAKRRALGEGGVNRPGFDAHLVTGVQPLAGLCL